MGFFQDLGLDEIVSSVRDMATEISGLKDDLVSGVKDDIASSLQQPVSDLKSTIQDAAGAISDDSSSN